MADVFNPAIRSGQCSDPQLKSADEASPFPRIEFHLARKPFKGFNNDGSDFRPETLNPGSGGSSDSRKPGGPGGQVQSGSGSGSGAKKSDGSEFLENGWDPELSFPITFRKIGAGLINMGNTCYLNSVLQCLTYTEPLAAYLQSGRHRNSCHIKMGFVLYVPSKNTSVLLCNQLRAFCQRLLSSIYNAYRETLGSPDRKMHMNTW